MRLLWNMGREAFQQLLSELRPPGNVDFETVWRFLGGNPAKLIELAARYEWSIDEMLRSCTFRLRSVVETVSMMELLEELRLVVENVREAEERAEPRMQQLISYLVEQNLLIYKHWVLLTSEPFAGEDVELGVGRLYAWQTPLYKRVLEDLLGAGCRWGVGLAWKALH